MVFAAAAGPSVAQTTAQRPDSSPPRLVRVTGSVDVPMINAGTPDAPLPAIEVMVNGTGPFRFGIETGARFLTITADAAQRAGIAGTGHADSITFGGAMLGDVPIMVMTRAPRGVDGLLGLPAFQTLLLTLDYPSGRVRISHDSLPAVNGTTILPLERVAAFWGIKVSYAAHRLTTVIDTRSMGSFAMDPREQAVLPWKEQPIVVGRAGGAGIPTTEIERGLLGGDVVIGEYHVTSPPIVLHQLPPNYPSEPRIGASVLSQFVVTLDQAHARIRLTRDGPSTFTVAR
jgi:hypothetical protein